MEGRDTNTMNRIENHLALDHNFPEKEPDYCQECSASLGEYGRCYNCSRKKLRVTLTVRGVISKVEQIEKALETSCEDYLKKQEYYSTNVYDLEREALYHARKYLKPRGWEHANVDVELLDD